MYLFGKVLLHIVTQDISRLSIYFIVKIAFFIIILAKLS